MQNIDNTLKTSPFKAVYVVDGSRTPFLKARGEPGNFSAADLAVMALRPLLARQPFLPSAIDEVITGCTMPNENEANISRIIALRAGLGEQVPAWTVQRNCASGLEAIDNAVKDIELGRHHLVLAGGTDSMSQAPLLFRRDMVVWLAKWMKQKTFMSKIKLLLQFRPRFVKPIIALLQGLTDPIVELNTGQTAEILAYRFNISRQEMDTFAFESHQRVKTAEEEGYLQEIVTLYDNKGQYYANDDGVRRDTTLEKLATLKPIFDKKFGLVTAGNSSQVTDGAAFLLLASSDAVKKYHLPVLGRIVDCEWAALSPAQMGLGPVHASTKLLQRHNLSLQDIDYWEINEAFAAQVLACIKAWEDVDYCKDHLGLNNALGSLEKQRLNIDGGAIAMGHPIGASGARLVLHLLKILERKKAKIGMVSLCIGGGQGGAMLIERVDGVMV